MQTPPRRNSRVENLLRTFWVLLTFAMIGISVAMFEAREDKRTLVLNQKSSEVLAEAVRAHPQAKEALEAMMYCVGKGYLRIDKTMDEEDINRPRQVCPKYAKVLEATHPSPIGMHDLSEAYAMLVTGLKANL